MSKLKGNKKKLHWNLIRYYFAFWPTITKLGATAIISIQLVKNEKKTLNLFERKRCSNNTLLRIPLRIEFQQFFFASHVSRSFRLWCCWWTSYVLRHLRNKQIGIAQASVNNSIIYRSQVQCALRFLSASIISGSAQVNLLSEGNVSVSQIARWLRKCLALDARGVVMWSVSIKICL